MWFHAGKRNLVRSTGVHLRRHAILAPLRRLIGATTAAALAGTLLIALPAATAAAVVGDGDVGDLAHAGRHTQHLSGGHRDD